MNKTTHGKRWVLYLMAAAAAAAALLGLLFSPPFRGTESALAAGAFETLRCVPEPGYTASYKVMVETQLKFDASALLGQAGGAQAQMVSSGAGLVGRLRARAIEKRDGGMLLGFSLDRLEGSAGALASDDAIRKELGEPFFAILEDSCRLRSFGFAKKTSPEVMNRLQGLMQSLSLSLRGSKGKRAWATQEWDTSGLYTAIYRRVDAERAFTKEHLSYVRPHSTSFGVKDTVDTRVLGSEMNAVLDEDFGWFEKLDDKEHLQVLRSNGTFIADVTITTKIEKQEDSEELPTLASAAKNLSWREESSPPIAVEARDPEPPEAMRTLPLEAALTQFAATYHAGDGLKAINFMKLYLRSRPEMAQELIGMIERQQIPSDLEPAIFHALERAHTPEAHEALLSGLGPKHTTDNRARAAAALPDIAQPDTRTLAGLREMARDGRASNPQETDLVKNAATFALGRLENRTRDSNPELARQTQQAIRDQLTGAKTSDARAAVLDAISNSGNPAFVVDVKPHFRAESQLERSHAIQALDHMPPEATKSLFNELMDGEKDPQVRGAIATTFADQARRANTVAPVEVLDSAIERLVAEPDPRVRGLLIDLIGPSCATYPKALEALAGQFSRESAPLLLKLIGKYVPAEKLGA